MVRREIRFSLKGSTSIDTRVTKSNFGIRCSLELVRFDQFIAVVFANALIRRSSLDAGGPTETTNSWTTVEIIAPVERDRGRTVSPLSRIALVC